MSDIRLNWKFIISLTIHNRSECNVHSTWNDIKNISSHLLLFSHPITNTHKNRDTSWALLFAVACVHLNSRMPLPIFLENHKYVHIHTQHSTAMQSEKIEAKWKILHRLVLLTTRLLQTHKSHSHVLRNCCSCSFPAIFPPKMSNGGQNSAPKMYCNCDEVCNAYTLKEGCKNIFKFIINAEGCKIYLPEKLFLKCLDLTSL